MNNRTRIAHERNQAARAIGASRRTAHVKRFRFGVATILAVTATAGCSHTPHPAVAKARAVTLARAPYEPDSGSVAVQCGTLIDGISDQPTHDVTVVIRSGRIASVDPGLRQPNGLALIDLRGYTCLPGLIDMHTHLTDRPEGTADLTVFFRRGHADQLALSAQHAKTTLRAGFTTVRNVGTYVAWSDRELRDAINAGRVAGPRMQVVGFYLTVPAGGGDLFVPTFRDPVAAKAEFHAGVARGPEQFRLKAQNAVEGGADLLKVIASGAVLAFGGVPGQPEMTREELTSVVRVAHADGRKVAAHAHGAQSIKDALLAGVDTIEHASLIDDEGIELARQRKVALSMDIYNGDYIDTEGRKQGWPAEFLRKSLETTELQRQGFTRAHAAGVPLVFSTDAGVYPHGLNARQFPVMVERGMTPLEAIKSATSIAAEYMGWADRVGQISPGRFGDLIALKGDPLQDIGRLQDVSAVIKGGLAFELPSN
jgi:imidazolonepropionase-like amidohydrolase